MRRSGCALPRVSCLATLFPRLQSSVKSLKQVWTRLTAQLVEYVFMILSRSRRCKRKRPRPSVGTDDQQQLIELLRSIAPPCSLCYIQHSLIHIFITTPSTIHLRFPNHEKGFSMDAKHAWFLSATRAGIDCISSYKIPGRETAAGYLSKGSFWRSDAPPMRIREA